VGDAIPTVVAAWRRAWAPVIPFFAFPPEIRRLIYTTNAWRLAMNQFAILYRERQPTI
jgi:transposase-like protein